MKSTTRTVVFVASLCMPAFVPGVTVAADIDLKRPIAITNARIITAPGQVIESGTIVIEDGRITAVGNDVAPPAHAERFNASGLVVYPGFIDACTHRGLSRAEPADAELARVNDVMPDVREGVQSATVEAYRRLIHPAWRASDLFDPADAKREDFRSAGVCVALAAPRTVIFSGQSAVIAMGDAPLRKSILRDAVAQHAAFVTSAGPRMGRRGGGGAMGYPATTMGAIAAFRQVLLDAAWHRDLLAWRDAHAPAERMALDRDLEALWPVLDGTTPIALQANTEAEIHRALDVADAFKLKVVLTGGREAWKAAERLKSAGVPVILSLNWSEEPKKPGKPVEQSADVHVDDAEKMARGIDRGPVFDEKWEEQPWEPKRVYDERVRLWQEEVDNAKALHAAGVPFGFGTYDLKQPGDLLRQVKKMLERELPEDAAVAALTANAANLLGVSEICGTIEAGKVANLTLLSGSLGEKKSEVKWVFVDGEAFDVGRRGEQKGRGGRRRPGAGGAAPEDVEPDTERREDASESEAESRIEPPVAKVPSQTTTASTAATPTTAPATSMAVTTGTNSAPSTQPGTETQWPEFASEIEADRKPAFQTGGSVLLRNATVLTIAGADQTEADVLIENGRITGIGRDLPAPAGIKDIDLTGYYVMPGIIDAHSHMCSDGGLNEWSLSATPEVRVADVVDPKDVGAFRALAGGVTMIHTMHGSANTIGGQNIVLRLKYGRPAREWLFKEAPRTVKFALGENVKQSNSQTRGTRFPNTRMGVESVFNQCFDAAVRYQQERDAFESEQKGGKHPRPVRRDLRLEALCDILAGRIWVHCHCYRADEILRLLDVAESFGFRIAVLQHVLEGYRVIPEIFRHGAATSTFSDWWAYKIEAYDAIPFNAARMSQAGIVTTVNSDSHEVIRHLNLEAAKSLCFGGLSPAEALRLITINAAVQLGVQEHVGSIEKGKRGDIAIFNGHPLDTFARCEMTLIDGEVFFQHRDFNPSAPADALPAPTFAPYYEDQVLRPEFAIGDPPHGEYWIRGGTIHPVSSEPIEDGLLIMSDGVIRYVGPDDGRKASSDVRTIGAKGLHVYPGLICVGVPLGLVEIESIAATVDPNDIARFQPELNALSAYNPFSASINVTRSAGVTSALIAPGGGIVQGRAGVVQLDGWSMHEARVRANAGLFVQLPSQPREFPWWMDDEAKERAKKEFPKSLADTEAFFRLAVQYARMKALGVSEADGGPSFDRRFEAMLPYVNREMPVFFRADSYKAIREALRFAEKFELRAAIYGGREAWKLADELAEKRVDVVIGQSMSLPGSFDPWDSIYANAAVLHRAGVRFCFSAAEASLAKQLGIEAGMAVAHGLDPAAALRAVTLDAAGMIGMDDARGSLDVGKGADVIVSTDSPLRATNRVLVSFINGRAVDLANKHTRDDVKFRSRPAPQLPPPPDALKGPPPMRLKPAA